MATAARHRETDGYLGGYRSLSIPPSPSGRRRLPPCRATASDETLVEGDHVQSISAQESPWAPQCRATADQLAQNGLQRTSASQSDGCSFARLPLDISPTRHYRRPRPQRGLARDGLDVLDRHAVAALAQGPSARRAQSVPAGQRHHAALFALSLRAARSVPATRSASSTRRYRRLDRTLTSRVPTTKGTPQMPPLDAPTSSPEPPDRRPDRFVTRSFRTPPMPGYCHHGDRLSPRR